MKTERGKRGNKQLIYKYCNRTRIIDGHYCTELMVEIIDKAKWEKGVILNLESDYSAVKVKYDLSSVWNWGADEADITGTIKVLKYSILGIKLKLDILVIPRGSSHPIVYKGRAVFR